MLQRDGKAAKKQADKVLALASEHGFAFWVAYATMLRGWALAELSQHDEGRGGIINLSGLLQNVKAGTFSTYCATKAFNAAFSECLNEELHGTGVDVVCLNPGYHPDTEILAAAGVPGSFPFPPGKSAALARYGLNALRKKKVMSVNGIFNKVLVQALKFMPIRLRQATNKTLVGTPEKRFAAHRA